MFQIECNFIGSFKTGDNIHYNMRLLRLLYASYAAASDADKALLRKPIIVTLVSVLEAVLSDFHMRVQVFTLEGVENLTEEVVGYIRGKRLEEFEKLIRSAQKHNIFRRNTPRLYELLDELRKTRNRVHIQNSKSELERDEPDVFSERRKEMAEKMLEWVVRFLATNHPRPDYVAGYVLPLEFAWNAHFPQGVGNLQAAKDAN